MSKKANSALIGFFVIAALAIAIIAIFILGSGSLFTESDEYVLYFDESIAGLDIGAPVEYGGVQVGTVSDLYLECNAENEAIRIPVFIKIDRNRIRHSNASGLPADSAYRLGPKLQAQLQLQSVLTAKLKVMLIMADNPQPKQIGYTQDVTEIPTMPSLFKSLENSFDELPLVEILNHLETTTCALAEIADSGQIPLLLKDLRSAIQGLTTLTATGDLPETIQSLKMLLDSVNGNVEPIAKDMGLTLEEIRETAQSARYLIDYLQRHPESILSGKGN